MKNFIDDIVFELVEYCASVVDHEVSDTSFDAIAHMVDFEWEIHELITPKTEDEMRELYRDEKFFYNDAFLFCELCKKFHRFSIPQKPFLRLKKMIVKAHLLPEFHEDLFKVIEDANYYKHWRN